jgi:arabinose-5-phosphate isomerase
MTNIIDIARRVINIEIEGLSTLLDRLDKNFENACNLIIECKGKVIVTGMGKSGLVGKKIAATFASTGTPSFFLHLAEAVHGDLGMVDDKDIVIAISNSGEQTEFGNILPYFQRKNIKIISLTGNTGSTLASFSDIILDVGVKEEACPLNLAPTASTTTALCMGDALAVTISKLRSFDKEDFARFHPGGALSKRLSKVSDYMHKGESIPIVKVNDPMKDVIVEITRKTLGLTTVLNNEGYLEGLITDGDLRRAIEKDKDFLDKPARFFMTNNPKTIKANDSALNAVSIMEKNYITAIIAVDDTGKMVGVLKFQDLLANKVI